MKRLKLERWLQDQGCVFHHHGGKHDVWINSRTLAQAPIPRHRDLKKGTSRGICRILGVALPPNL